MTDDEELTTEQEKPRKSFSKRILHRIILIALIVGLFIVGSTIFLGPTDPLAKADAIVAISGGDTYSRTIKAVDLYHAGWAPKVIFSGAARDPNSPSNAEVMKQVAQANGVPLSAIETDKSSKNTHQNAILSGTLLKDSSIKTIILVTSQYHQRRASIEFAHSLGENVRIINQPAKDYYWNQYTWWLSPQGWCTTATELVKIPVALIRGY